MGNWCAFPIWEHFLKMYSSIGSYCYANNYCIVISKQQVHIIVFLYQENSFHQFLIFSPMSFYVISACTYTPTIADSHTYVRTYLPKSLNYTDYLLMHVRTYITYIPTIVDARMYPNQQSLPYFFCTWKTV